MLLDLFRASSAQRRNGLFWLLAAGFLVACRDRKNVLEPILRSNLRGEYFINPRVRIYPETFGCEKGARDGWGIYVLVRIRGRDALRILHQWRLISPGPYECSHAGLKVREFWQHIEGNRP